MKKTMLAVCLAATTTLGLAACSSSPQEEEGASPSEATSAGAEAGAGDAEMVSFTHPHPRLEGQTIELPANPERLVIDCFSLQTMADYGLEPIAIFGSDCNNPNVVGDINVDEYEIIGQETEIDIERLAELRPDVIVGNSPDGTGPTRFDEDVKEQMRRVAPFVALPVGTSVEGDIEAARAVAEALGGDVDSGQIAQDDADFEAAKDAFQDAVEGKDLNVMLAVASNEVVRTGVGFKQANLLEDLGVGIVGAPAPAQGNPWGQVAWEDMGTYPADVILTEDYGSEDAFTSELWESLPAVEEDQLEGWSSKGNHSARYYAEWLGGLAQRFEQWQKLT